MTCKRGCCNIELAIETGSSVTDKEAEVMAALLSACERVLERWETHDGQMNHVNDIRAAVDLAKSLASKS